MDDDAIRRWIEELRNDPEQQRMMAEIEERTRRLRAHFEGVDVTTLDEQDWHRWLSVHHVFEQYRAMGARQNDRYRRKMADRAAGRPWLPNDPRARLCRRDPDPAS